MVKDKKPTILGIRGKTSVSTSALSQLLKSVDRQGLPSAKSQTTLRRQRQKICTQKTPYGVLLDTLDIPCGKGTHRIAIQNPLAFTYVALRKSQVYREEMFKLLERANGKLKLALYSDGVAPGAVLSHNHDRKMETIFGHGKTLNPRCFMMNVLGTH